MLVLEEEQEVVMQFVETELSQIPQRLVTMETQHLVMDALVVA